MGLSRSPSYSDIKLEHNLKFIHILFLLFTSFSFLEADILFNDNFKTNTISEYTINTYTGFGSINYSNEQMYVDVGDNNYVLISHSLPSLNEGTFSIDFNAIRNYPNSADITLRLEQDAQNYYEIYNTDRPDLHGPIGIKKVINGIEVERDDFLNGYTQDSNYSLNINFSSTQTVVNAFGESLLINNTTTSITINSFSITLAQQDAYLDNILLNTSSDPLVNTPPVANAGSDKSVQVGNTVSITGSGTDTDGSIVSYEWKQGSTVIATTASFDYTPSVIGDQILTLTVTDNKGAVGTDSMLLTVTDVVVPVSETIVDNRDRGFSSTGSWSESGAHDEYAGSSLYSYTSSNSATWTPALTIAGTYEVFVWYTGSAAYDRDMNAVYTIVDTSGSDTRAINQDQGSGNWVSLGVYTFNAGTAGSVTLQRDTNAVGTTSADAMKFVLLQESEAVHITAPLTAYIQSGNSIVTHANTTITKNGWGVKFILDEGNAGEMSFLDINEPYEAIFENLQVTEHTINVYIVDENGLVQTGDMMHDQVNHIGTGGEIMVAFGDSITHSYKDDVSIDDISNDGRNSGGGFEPILNNLLTLETGQPHSILNEGVNGNTSAEALARLPQVMSAHPEANTYLIMFGTNDANPCCSLLIDTFRTNMQQIIDTLKSAGKTPILAKAPRVMSDYFTDPTYYEQGIDPEDGRRNILIRSYNDVIDELVASNNITVVPPDFYTYFKDTYGDTYSVSTQDGYIDNFHPDNLGYSAIAELWKDALIVN